MSLTPHDSIPGLYLADGPVRITRVYRGTLPDGSEIRERRSVIPDDCRSIRAVPGSWALEDAVLWDENRTDIYLRDITIYTRGLCGAAVRLESCHGSRLDEVRAHDSVIELVGTVARVIGGRSESLRIYGPSNGWLVAGHRVGEGGSLIDGLGASCAGTWLAGTWQSCRTHAIQMHDCSLISYPGTSYVEGAHGHGIYATGTRYVDFGTMRITEPRTGELHQAPEDPGRRMLWTDQLAGWDLGGLVGARSPGSTSDYLHWPAWSEWKPLPWQGLPLALTSRGSVGTDDILPWEDL